MTSVAEFLLARIDEDEEVARAAGGVPWETIQGVRASQVLVAASVIRDNKLAYGHLGHVATVEHSWDLDHIARHDPARVLADCATKRALVARETAQRVVTDTPVLRLLAATYAHHPDYDREWESA